MSDQSGDSFRASDPSLKPDSSGEWGSSIPDPLLVGSVGPFPQDKTNEEAYEVFGPRLGQGGQGEVLRAVQRRLARVVALKRVHSSAIGPSKATADVDRRKLSFFQEALITACLDHPNIVPVHDLGTDPQGRPFLAMKLVRGAPWNQMIIADRSMPVGEFLTKHLSVLVSVAQAAAFAHSRGIVHRDLHPGQVMVGSFGEVYLSDWGLALLFDQDKLKEFLNDEALGNQVIEAMLDCVRAPKPDQAKGPAGSPAYLSPEQARASASNVGPWTDVYLLGGILYYLLTDCVPHPDITPELLSEEVEVEETLPARERAPNREMPQELVDLCEQCLSKQLDHRPTAQVIIAGLRDYLSGSGRKKESEEIVAAVESRLASAGQRDYKLWASCDRELNRALQLWPDNIKAQELHLRCLTSYAELAISSNDLQLASTLSGMLPEKSQQPLAVQIDRATTRNRRIRQQRTAGALAAAVLLLVVSIFWYNWHLSARDREFSDRLNELLAKEIQLAQKLDHEVTVPTRVAESMYDAPEDQIDKELYAGLLEEVGVLVSERERLRAESGRILPDPPPSLQYGEGFIRLELSDKEEEMKVAQEKFEAVMDNPADRPFAMMGLSIIDARHNRHDQAFAKLEEVRTILRDTEREEKPEYKSLLFLMESLQAHYTIMTGDQKTAWNELLEVLEKGWIDSSRQLATYHMQVANLDECDSLTALAWQVAGNTLREDHWLEAELRQIEGNSAILRGKSLEAMSPLRNAVESYRQTGEANDLRVAFLLCELGWAKTLNKFPEEGLQDLQEAVAVANGALAEGNWQRGYFLSRYSVALLKKGDYEQAIANALEAVRCLEGTRNDHLAFALTALGDAYFQNDQTQEVIDRLEPVLKKILAENGDNVPRPFCHALSIYAEALVKAGRFEEALDCMEIALQSMEKAGSDDDLQIHTVALRLAGTLYDARRYEDVVNLCLRMLRMDEDTGTMALLQRELFWNLFQRASGSMRRTDVCRAGLWEMMDSFRRNPPNDYPRWELAINSYISATKLEENLHNDSLALQLRLEILVRVLRANVPFDRSEKFFADLLDLSNSGAVKAGDGKLGTSIALMKLSICPPVDNRMPPLNMFWYMTSVAQLLIDEERRELPSICRATMQEILQNEVLGKWGMFLWLRTESELAIHFSKSEDPAEKRAAGILAARVLSFADVMGSPTNSHRIALTKIADEEGTMNLVRPADERPCELPDRATEMTLLWQFQDYLDEIGHHDEFLPVIEKYPIWDAGLVPNIEALDDQVITNALRYLRDDVEIQKPDDLVQLPWR